MPPSVLLGWIRSGFSLSLSVFVCVSLCVEWNVYLVKLHEERHHPEQGLKSDSTLKKRREEKKGVKTSQISKSGKREGRESKRGCLFRGFVSLFCVAVWGGGILGGAPLWCCRVGAGHVVLEVKQGDGDVIEDGFVVGLHFCDVVIRV